MIAMVQAQRQPDQRRNDIDDLATEIRIWRRRANSGLGATGAGELG